MKDTVAYDLMREKRLCEDFKIFRMRFDSLKRLVLKQASRKSSSKYFFFLNIEKSIKVQFLKLPFLFIQF